MRVYDGKIQCNILGSQRFDDDLRIRSNNELLNVKGIVQHIIIQRLCCLGYAVLVEEDISGRRVFDVQINRSRRKGHYAAHYHPAALLPWVCHFSGKGHSGEAGI